MKPIPDVFIIEKQLWTKIRTELEAEIPPMTPTDYYSLGGIRVEVCPSLGEAYGLASQLRLEGKNPCLITDNELLKGVEKLPALRNYAKEFGL